MELRGDIVKQLRLSRGWTQQHLAEVCDVNMRTIQRVENTGNGSLETVMALCVAFNVKRETLFEVPKPQLNHRITVSHKRWPLVTFCVGLGCGLALSVAANIFM